MQTGWRNSVHGVSSAVRTLHHLILGGGIVTLVREFFDMAVERAEKLKGTVDDNAEAVREFGEGLHGIKEGFADVALVTVGFFNRAGQGWGDLINYAKAYVMHGHEGVEAWRENAAAIAETGHEAEEAEVRLAKAKKEHGAEFLAITKELADTEKKSQELKLKGLTLLETQQLLETHISELIEKQANPENDKITQRRLQVEIARTQLALDENILAVAKQSAEQTKKEDDELEKQAEKANADRALDEKSELELFALKQKNIGLLTKAERERLDVLTLQKKEKENQVSITELEQKLVSGTLTPAEEKQLSALMKQGEEIQKQIAKKTEVVQVITEDIIPAEDAVAESIRHQTELEQDYLDELDEQNEKFSHSISQKGDVKTLSDNQLQALQGKVSGQLATTKNQDATTYGVGILLGTYRSIEQVLEQNNLDAIQRELDARRQFKEAIQAFGKEYAERTFSPDEFAGCPRSSTPIWRSPKQKTSPASTQP
jgi:hypothetical protein